MQNVIFKWDLEKFDDFRDNRTESIVFKTHELEVMLKAFYVQRETLSKKTIYPDKKQPTFIKTTLKDCGVEV